MNIAIELFLTTFGTIMGIVIVSIFISKIIEQFGEKS
jgi:hypothetical protein